jgi:hypothetical protein
MGDKKSVYDLSSYKYSEAFTEIHSETSLKSSAFKEFLDEGESLVKAKQDKLDAELDRLYAQDDEEGQIFEQHDHYLLSEINNTLQESFLLAATSYLYSQFEYSLIKIAIKTGELLNAPVDLVDFKIKCRKNRNQISKALEYIKEYSKISIIEMEDDWRRIKKFQRIRNCIVHANGIIKSNYEGLDIYAEEHPNLVYEKSTDQIKVTKEYLLDMSKICFNYSDKIMEKVWDKVKS